MGSECLLVRGRLLGAEAATDIVLKNGTVRKVARAGTAPADFGSDTAFIAPALFDIQVNGVGGFTLQGGHAVPEDLLRITRYLARRGVARWVPTLVTGSQEAMEHGCRVAVEALRDAEVARAVPGLHLEGPYISPMDGPRGAHPQAHVRPPSLREFNRFMKAAEDRVLYITVAPETPGAPEFIRSVVKRGVTVSLGHHHANEAQIARAVDAGARLSTHLGNGAASMIHRHQNPLWPQLAEDRLCASLIADLHHLPKPALKTFVRAKGPERTILVSDCVNLAGMAPGVYELFGASVEMKPDGKICLRGTDLLAGSGLMLLQGVINAWRATDLSLAQAVACASTVPARLFGLKTPPMATPGRKANLMVFDLDKADRATARGVWIQGERAQ